MAFCGGLHKVLSALGLPRDIVRATEDDHLVFGLQHYAFVRRRLAGSTALGWEGLRPGSLIPEPALTALRYACCLSCLCAALVQFKSANADIADLCGI